MFNVRLGTVDAQIDGNISLGIISDSEIGNQAVITAHYEDDETFEESTVVLFFTEEKLEKLLQAITRAKEGLSAAEQSGIVGLAKWAEKNAV